MEEIVVYSVSGGADEQRGRLVRVMGSIHALPL
jgi:hypothetical protein